jgi:hypothetical protein
MQLETIKLSDAESTTGCIDLDVKEVNEQLEQWWEEPNVELQGGIKNRRRGNWTRVKNTRGKKLAILARKVDEKRRYLTKRASVL